MQIQRLQNLFLFIALALMAVSIFLPWWSAGAETITPLSNPMLLILCCLAAAMALIGIILFRNLRRQKLVCGLSALIGLLAATYGAAMTFMDTDTTISISYGASIMALGAIFAIMARNRVIHDENLLKSADRLR